MSTDYVIEFKTDKNKIFRILVKDNGIEKEIHIYALTRIAEFILDNDIESITILKCKGYICDEVIANIKVIGI